MKKFNFIGIKIGVGGVFSPVRDIVTFREMIEDLEKLYIEDGK